MAVKRIENNPCHAGLYVTTGTLASTSLFLSTSYALLVTLTSAMVGFAFARLPGFGKGLYLSS